MSSTEPTTPQPTNIHRRRFLQMAGAAGVAGVGGNQMAVQQAQAIPHLVAGAAAGIVIGSGISVALTGSISDDDIEEIQEANAEVLHANIYSDAIEAEEQQENSLQSIRDNIAMLQEYVRTNVAATIAERVELGDSEQEVIDAAKDTVREDVASIESNLMSAWASSLAVPVARRIMLVEENEDLNAGFAGVFTMGDMIGGGEVGLADTYEWDMIDETSSGRPWPASKVIDFSTDGGEERTAEWVDFQMANNDVISVPVMVAGDRRDNSTAQDSGSTNIMGLIPWAENPAGDSYSYGDEFTESVKRMQDWDGYLTDHENAVNDSEQNVNPVYTEFRVTDPDGGESASFDCRDWVETHAELLDLLEQELAHAETITSTMYQPIKDGDVDAHEIASGKAILEAAEDWDHYGEAAGIYRSVNMPEGHTEAVVHTGGAILTGTLFWNLPSDGGLPVGTEIEPEQELGEIHMAADVEVPDEDDTEDEEETEEDDDETDGGDVDVGDLSELDGETITTELTEPFTIVGLNDGNSTLSFDERELTDPDEYDAEQWAQVLEEASQREQITREERTEVIVESGGASLPGFPEVGDWGESAVMGLAVIAGAVLLVVGIVSNVLDNLLP